MQNICTCFSYVPLHITKTSGNNIMLAERVLFLFISIWIFILDERFQTALCNVRKGAFPFLVSPLIANNLKVAKDAASKRKLFQTTTTLSLANL